MWEHSYKGLIGQVTEEQYLQMKDDIAFQGFKWKKLSEAAPKPKVEAPATNKPDSQAKA